MRRCLDDVFESKTKNGGLSSTIVLIGLSKDLLLRIEMRKLPKIQRKNRWGIGKADHFEWIHESKKRSLSILLNEKVIVVEKK